MKLFLIRHAESEANVSGILAGVTDSRLTSHGVLQTERLAEYFASNNIHFSRIFSSDLQRARITAEAIRDAQVKKADSKDVPELTVLEVLREQDFGSFEGMLVTSKEAVNADYTDPSKPGYKPKETKQAMRVRADKFLDESLIPLIDLDSTSSNAIAVVAHGIFLSILWKALLARVSPSAISLAEGVGSRGGTQLLEYLPSWSNTGYLELEISKDSKQNNVNSDTKDKPSTQQLSNYHMEVMAVNSKEHLNNLKRTRGGVGSAPHDARQQKLEPFLKKPKIDGSI